MHSVTMILMHVFSPFPFRNCVGPKQSRRFGRVSVMRLHELTLKNSESCRGPIDITVADATAAFVSGTLIARPITQDMLRV